ncbi:Ribosomal protein L11 methyltransferase [Halomonadaceae bacterium LMG 33818]|uniref:50S ribosomal protein L11 methyltransferase n=1 Tax=Cernens ardua TaxID=3402176 RepID=UPI003EDC5928
MAWLQLKARIAPSQAELLESLLLDQGAQAITLEDAEDRPLYEPDIGTTPLWAETILTGLYDDLEGIESMLERVRAEWASVETETPCPEIEYEILQDRDWSREWMDGFEPLKMGQKLWIVPSWTDAPEPEAVNLMLDPGLAFGTGTHPTTALCLQWLDTLSVEGHLDNTRVLDYGCGSGILAIAALKLGASVAHGVDIDPQALLASRDNAERNGISEDRLTLALAEQAQAPTRTDYDIVVANILAGPLVELAPLLASYIPPGGQFALSGILANQAEGLEEAYQAQGLNIDHVETLDGWVRINGHRT